MKNILIFVLLLGAITGLYGCGKGRGSECLARIDDKYTITLKDFNARIGKLPARYQDVINQNKREFLDELVVDTLLYDEAVKKKLENDAEVKEVFAEAKKKIMIARLLRDEIDDKAGVTEEEIEAYYAENKERFATPERRRASHILVRTEKEANEILAELASGRNFEDLAKTRSTDPTSNTGGDIGYFSRGQLVPEIEEICFNMDEGQISGVVKTRFGYHIIKLTEIEEPRIRNLDEVRDAIAQALGRAKKKKLFDDFVDELKERAKITINDKLLERISEDKATKVETPKR